MKALESKLNRSSPAGATGSQVNGESGDMVASRNARYTKLIVQLRDLENINKIFVRYIDWLRTTTTCSTIRLPTLFSEIFDIPISSRSSSGSTLSESICGDDYNDSDESPPSETQSNLDEVELANGKNDVMLIIKQEPGDAHCVASPITVNTSSSQMNATNSMIQQIHSNQHLQLNAPIDDQDFIFDLSSFQDSDDRIEAADLNPTVDCLNI